MIGDLGGQEIEPKIEPKPLAANLRTERHGPYIPRLADEDVSRQHLTAPSTDLALVIDNGPLN